MSTETAVAAPFFVIGFQRSGTTLLRMMLDSHPEVAIPLDVTGLWSRYAERLDDYDGLRSTDAIRRLIGDLLAEERIGLWQVPLDAARLESSLTTRDYAGVIAAFYGAYAHAKGKRRWGDKDPGNMVRLHEIYRWFPDARIVHIVRDGRDACLSQIRQEFGHSEVVSCAADWREQVWWVRCIGGILGPERYHEVRYEDLLAEPEARLRALCDFLDLDYDAAMLDYHRRTSDAIPDSKRHIWPMIDRPPIAANAERWRREMSPGLRICFEKRAGEVLRACGYDALPNPSGAYLEEVKFMSRRALRAVRKRF